MVQERVHYEALENSNHDSENYYIRIRREYSNVFPESFIQGPK